MTHLTSRAIAHQGTALQDGSFQDGSFQDATIHRAGAWGRFADGRAGEAGTRVRWNIAALQVPSAGRHAARG